MCHEINWTVVIPLICGLSIPICFALGLRNRRYVWEPLWLAGLTFVVSLVGAVWSAIQTCVKLLMMAHEAGSLELIEGLLLALAPCFYGLIFVAVGILASFILWKRREPCPTAVLVDEIGEEADTGEHQPLD
jgi:hypothetical protein